MLTLNEAPRIPITLPPLKKYCDYVLVDDSESTDGTPEKAAQWADQVLEKSYSGSQAEERNFAASQLPGDIDWILMVDADEVFSMGFLEGMHRLVSQQEHYSGVRGTHIKVSEATAFKFPRINLPDGIDFPDWQVRFYRNLPEMHWVGHPHDKLYRGDVRVDEVSCLPLEIYPIVHLQRREDEKRPWW